MHEYTTEQLLNNTLVDLALGWADNQFTDMQVSYWGSHHPIYHPQNVNGKMIYSLNDNNSWFDLDYYLNDTHALTSKQRTMFADLINGK